MTRKVCVVTGSRAEYGLLRELMLEIRNSASFELQLVVTGMHLDPAFGLTYRELEADGFVIDRKIDMLLSSDTATGLAKSMGLGLIGFGDALNQLSPDLLVVLGDRFEILPAVIAALVARLPVAHLHGGETTEGAFDESIRHSITKMSHLHFVAAEEYRRRVIQMGEDPSRVYTVGALGVDNICNIDLLDRVELENSLDFELGDRNLLVTFHPVTLDEESSKNQMKELLAALDSQSDTHLIFTMPNADTEGRELITMINDYVSGRSSACAFASLGQLRYLSCMRHVDAVVGNSSSGIIEAPSMQKGTINIGDRQRGRIKAASVIDCAANREDIVAALEKLYSKKFQVSLSSVANPYGLGDAAKKVFEVLEKCSFENLVKKSFYDSDVAH